MKYEICNIYDFNEQQATDMYFAMDANRRARADRFMHAEDRMRCICADMLARKMLSEAFYIAGDEITFTVGEKGKPSANLPFQFNVSHSGDYVICAVSKAPIGVDIEQIKPFRAGLVSRYFSQAEAAYVWGENATDLEKIVDHTICARFYRVWTAKEAYVKMTGTGISTDLKQICYDPDAKTVCGIPLLAPNAPEGYVISIVKSDL